MKKSAERRIFIGIPKLPDNEVVKKRLSLWLVPPQRRLPCVRGAGAEGD